MRVWYLGRAAQVKKGVIRPDVAINIFIRAWLFPKMECAHTTVVRPGIIRD